jgi:hypothetical protein
MAGALEYLDVGVGRERLPQLGLQRRSNLVLLAPEQKRRHREPMQLPRQLGIAILLYGDVAEGFVATGTVLFGAR